jgi:hypothetical protein
MSGAAEQHHLPREGCRWQWFHEIIISARPKRTYLVHKRGLPGDTGNENPFEDWISVYILDEGNSITIGLKWLQNEQSRTLTPNYFIGLAERTGCDAPKIPLKEGSDMVLIERIWISYHCCWKRTPADHTVLAFLPN